MPNLERIIEGLRANFTGECAEVGMYLAMSRQADREGYPEIAEAFKRYAFEEADHAARFAELLGEVLTNSTEENVKMRAAAEKLVKKEEEEAAAAEAAAEPPADIALLTEIRDLLKKE